MVLLLYGFSCDMLGGVPLMFLWIFHLGYYHVIFLSLWLTSLWG